LVNLLELLHVALDEQFAGAQNDDVIANGLDVGKAGGWKKAG